MAAALSQMSKADLTDELKKAGHAMNPKWTVPELRELVREMRQIQNKDGSAISIKIISARNTYWGCGFIIKAIIMSVTRAGILVVERDTFKSILE